MSNIRSNPQVSTVRANEQVWRLAEYLALEVVFEYEDMMRDGEPLVDFKDYHYALREFFYDKAADLLKKIENREFTGPDNHE